METISQINHRNYIHKENADVKDSQSTKRQDVRLLTTCSACRSNDWFHIFPAAVNDTRRAHQEEDGVQVECERLTYTAQFESRGPVGHVDRYTETAQDQHPDKMADNTNIHHGGGQSQRSI